MLEDVYELSIIIKAIPGHWFEWMEKMCKP
jgi:hypothetical protein